ncbi:MAG: D-alanyl-D-alanine carboxypeptidase family protein [Spirochaetia bacterium]
MKSLPLWAALVPLLLFFSPAGLFSAPGAPGAHVSLQSPQGLGRWYPTPPEISARSAVVLDADTGAVLFEKNADIVIPPASLTKLAAMQVALRATETGRVALEDDVQLTPESYAHNMPPGSSLMFLGPGQQVTVDELLRGLAVPSGNDAAAALAYHISGGVPQFIEEMNSEMERLGLQQTRFEEPSGYSPLNKTTAREFAEFVRQYLNTWPETLNRYHSLKEYAYPAAENLIAPHAEAPIIQRNRNTLLWDYPGVDGLKTGFIPSSGYNIALTGERGGRRLIIVLLGAPGETHALGGANRSRDGKALLDYGFDEFETLELGAPQVTGIRVWKGDHPDVELAVVTAPRITLPQGLQDQLAGELEYEDELEAPVHSGRSYGRAVWRVGETTVVQAPLVAQADVARGGPLSVLYDTLRLFFRSVGDFFSSFLSLNI